MQPKILSALSALTVLAACAAPVPQAPPPRPTTPPEAANAQQMLEIINKARAEARTCGDKEYAAAPPLKWNDALARSAQHPAEDMAAHSFFSHDGQDGRNPYQRMQAEGYRYSFAAENIAHGQQSVQAVLASWLKSPGHCRNIMNRHMTEIGMAVAHNPETPADTTTPAIYWVQNFASPFRSIGGTSRRIADDAAPPIAQAAKTQPEKAAKAETEADKTEKTVQRAAQPQPAAPAPDKAQPPQAAAATAAHKG